MSAKIHKIRRKRAKRAELVQVEFIVHPLVMLSRREKDYRKRRLMVMLAKTLDRLDNNEVTQIERILVDALGRFELEAIEAALKEEMQQVAS